MLRDTVTLHRRDYLKLGVASIAGIGLGTSLIAEDTKPIDAGFNLSIQSYTFREFKLEQAVDKISKLKVPYVEFYNGHVNPKSTPEQIKAVLKLCKENNVTPISFGVEGFTKDNAKNKALFDFAAAMGLKYLTADPTVDSFDSLDKLTEEYKINIAIHPHGPTGPIAKKGKARWTTAEQIMKAIKDHSERIGTCLDTGHLIRMALIDEPVDVVEQIKIMGKRNYGFHMKDHDNKTDHDVVFGNPAGVLKVPEILKALREVKFAGFMSIEYEYNSKEPTKDVEACVKYLRENFAKLA